MQPHLRRTPLGTPFRIPGHLVATVVDFQSNGVDGGHEPVERYADLNVRVCSLAGSVVSSATWGLITATGDSVGSVVTDGALHEPQYPSVGDPLNAGECVQGWITFVVPRTLKIKAAEYSPSTRQGQPLAQAMWKLSASPPVATHPAPPPASRPTRSCTSGYSPCIPPGPDVDCAGGSGNGPRYVQGPV